MFSVTFFFAVLLILFPTTGAVGSECKIYVSSSNGISNASCWTGGYQTPCATLDLALQGTASTAAGNCSSFSIIYLYPGEYALDATTGLEEHNNVSIIGNGSKDVSVRVLSTESQSFSENDCPFDLNVTVVNPSLSFSCPKKCALIFTASIINRCNPEPIEWKSNLTVYLESSLLTTLVYQTCFMCSSGNCTHGGFFLHLSSYPIFNFDNKTIELTLSTSSIVASNITMNVTVACQELYVVNNGSCQATCDKQDYCPLVPASSDEVCYYNGVRCAYCPQKHGTLHGVPINGINKCVQCDNHVIKLLIFIGIEILPITIMVLLIIILNIQLTNGSINGLVFYSQIIFFIYSDYILLLSTEIDRQKLVLPCNVFNLDFTPFLQFVVDYSYSLCIVPNMSPLGAISFWYVIGFYPLLLLLLIYVWIVLYDKGFKCVVLVTRPFHRCMARFWSMTGIEPSLIHSTASIYILCFTQIARVSFKILHFGLTFDNSDSINGSNFFYDAKIKYFQGDHAAAGSVAILVLIVVIIMPTLYIQFYRFKWFHKLLGILHLRKQLLLSLGDVFTGPYKNGSDNTFDYRFFAGFYLLARLIIMSFILPIRIVAIASFWLSFYILMAIQGFCVFLLAIMVLIFRPFKRNIHNFFEVIMLILEIIFFVSLIIVTNDNIHYTDNCPPSLFGQHETAIYIIDIIGYTVTSFNCLLFGIILPSYILYQLVRTMCNCYRYWKQHNHTVPAKRDQEEDIQLLINDNDDWAADRMENPQDYDEQHVTASLLDSFPIDTEQPSTTAATYGSTNN